MYDVIIIGGGPAGITAGIYAARQKLKTLLLTKEFGGQIGKKAVEIENYPGFSKISGPDLIKKFREHLGAQEIEIKMGVVRKVEKDGNNFLVFTSEKEKFLAKTVIVATGADPRPLEVPGEKEFIGRGVSYCVTCDGPIFKNKTIAVIGGGNAGFEAAIFMTHYATKIYILEYGFQVGADQVNQEIARKSKKIKVIINAEVKEIKGKNFVEALIYDDLKTKKEKILEVQGVFVEIGSQPATSFIKGLVDFNERDEIKVEFETFQTKTPGLFAVGDCNMGKYKQIVTAAGEGCKAALAAYEYVKKNGLTND